MPTPAKTNPGQHDFEWLLPWGPHKTILTTIEAAKVLCVGDDFIRALIDSNELEAHGITAMGTRLTNRITRRSFSAYLARSAKYGSDEIGDQLFNASKTLTAPQLSALIPRLQKLLSTKNHQ